MQICTLNPFHEQKCPGPCLFYLSILHLPPGAGLANCINHSVYLFQMPKITIIHAHPSPACHNTIGCPATSLLILHPICHFQCVQARCRLLEMYQPDGQPWIAGQQETRAQDQTGQRKRTRHGMVNLATPAAHEEVTAVESWVPSAESKALTRRRGTKRARGDVGSEFGDKLCVKKKGERWRRSMPRWMTRTNHDLQQQRARGFQRCQKEQTRKCAQWQEEPSSGG